MKYGLLGGSFDPVHCGHIQMAREALRAGLDEVVVMPCRLSPHKTGSPTAGVESAAHRWAMLQLAFANMPGVTLSRFELDGPSPSYTHRTIGHLQTEHPNEPITLIIGFDQLVVLDQWANYAEWAKTIRFLVFNRGDEPSQSIPEKYAHLNIRFVEEKVSPASSTLVRERIAHGESLEGIVPPEVERYIREHRLYR